MRELSEKEVQVSLQRKWRLGHPDDGMPDDITTLSKLVPSGLSEEEKFNFILGSLEDAKMAYIRVLNTSWSKVELQRRLLEAGVPSALEAFDAETIASLKEVERYLSDE